MGFDPFLVQKPFPLTKEQRRKLEKKRQQELNKLGKKR